MSNLIFDEHTRLKEVLDWVVEQSDTHAKAARLRQVAEKYPGFLTFLKLAYNVNPPYTFKQALAVGPIKPRSIDAPDKHSLPIKALAYLQHELPTYSDQSGMKPRFKHSKLLQSLDFMEAEDCKLVLNAIQGIAPDIRKINLLVLKLAFPGEFALGEA